MNKEHFDKYEGFAQQIGIQQLRNLVLLVAPLEKIKGALEKDPNLNNIRLNRWDSMDHSVRSMVKGPWSLCNSVCVLKHVAKYHL